MADLDDFFAKKDRKKSKGNKKFSTTEEVAKKLEDNAKKTEKEKKARTPAEGEDNVATELEQDEWKDFEEEKKDYSGLKIGNLTLHANAESSTGASKEPNVEQQQDEDNGQETEKKVGPWKRIDLSEMPSQEEPKPEPKPEPKVNASGVYVAPGFKNAGQQQHAPPTRLRSRVAPNIHSEEFFPTLSKTSEHKKNRNDGSFELVQHSRSTSHRQAEQSKINSSQGPKLNLGNRYNTLSNDS